MKDEIDGAHHARAVAMDNLEDDLAHPKVNSNNSTVVIWHPVNYLVKCAHKHLHQRDLNHPVKMRTKCYATELSIVISCLAKT